MMKINIKTFLLATSAICAVNSFPNTAKADYTPTRGVDNAAYTVSAGSAESYDFYTINSSGEKEYYNWVLKTGTETGAPASRSITITLTSTSKPSGAYFTVVHGVDESGNPKPYYYKYSVESGVSPAPYIGKYVEASYSTGKYDASGAAINNSSGATRTLNADFIKNYVKGINTARGGAIFNEGTITTLTGDFIGNYAYNASASSGGAIYSEGAINTITGDFIGNYASGTGTNSGSGAYGGAIMITNSTIGTITGDFIGNYVNSAYNAYGGAIYNNRNSYYKNSSITTITGDFIGNYAQGKRYSQGGAISNTGDISTLTGNFIGNYVKSSDAWGTYGGAIYNGGSISTITGDFIGNYAQSKSDVCGGAIYNVSTYSGYITFVADASDDSYEDDILFKGNYISTNDDPTKNYEAIYNRGTITFKSINNGSYTFYDYINGNGDGTIKFTAVDNENEDPDDDVGYLNLYNNIKGHKNVNFTGDWNLDMRSEDNDETPGNPYNSITAKNIVINNGLSVAIDVNFAENKADKFSATTSGSGIITLDTINVIGTPTEGTVQIVYDPTGGLQLALGEAYADEVLISGVTEEVIDEVTTPLKWSDELMHRTITTGTFGKYALNEAKDSLTLYDLRSGSSESSTSLGDTLALLARSTDVTDPKEFNAVAGTTTYNLSDDIGAMKGILTVNGLEGVASTLNMGEHAGFTLGEGASALSFNDLTVNGGTVANVTNGSAAINLKNVTFNGNITGTTAYNMAIDGDNTLNGTITGANIKLHQNTAGTLTLGPDSAFVNSSMTVYGGTVDTVNKKTGTVTLNNLTVAGTTTMNVEIDLESAIMDYVSADSITVSSGTLNLSFTMLSETGNTRTEVAFVGPNQISEEDLEYAKNISSKSYTYEVSFNEKTGEFVFINKSRGTPGRIGGTKSVASSTSATTATTGAVAGEVMSHGGTTVYNGMNSGDEPLGLSAWVKAFGSSDDVELKNLSQKIDTQFHGVVGGIDSKRFAYDNGLSAVYGVFGAYVQGRQKTDDNKTTQKSGYLGLSAALRKEAVFSNFSLIGGFIANESNTPWGKDKFDTKVISVANQTGVDIRKDEWTITPALTLSYTGIDTDDYTAKSGVKVENKFMNVFMFAPELKVAKDLSEGLEGYAKAAYKMFFYDNNKITADDVLMPTISVKPYVEYGLGLKKDWSKEEWNPKDITTYAEITRHDGGREGWNVNLGLKFDF